MKFALNVMVILFYCHFLFFHEVCEYPMKFLNFHLLFAYFPIKEMNCFCKIGCRCKNKHFDVHFWRIRSFHFPSKDGKYASSEGRNGWKNVCFPPDLASLMYDFIRLLFLICNLAREQLFLPPRKNINRKNWSTKIKTLVLMIITGQFSFSYDSHCKFIKLISVKEISVFTVVSYFHTGNGNTEK